MDYLGLNVTLNRHLVIPDSIKNAMDIDTSLKAMRESIASILRDEGVDDRVLSLMFIKDRYYNPDFTDEGYLEVLSQDFEIPLLNAIADALTDQYVIEFFLRMKSYPKVERGYLKPLIKTKDIKLGTLLSLSPYYKWYGNIDLENYHRLFDEYLYNLLKPYRYVSIGLEGIIARVMMWSLELRNHAVELKALRHNVDATALLRRFV